MAAPIRTTREAWIAQGLAMLATGGPDSVRIEPLAAALGVSKGGFYGQFADRGELLDAMLDSWEREAVDDAIHGLPTDSADAARRSIRQAGIATFSTGWLRPIDLAVREWARRDEAVARRLERVDRRRMTFLRSQFSLLYEDPVEVEARCLLAFCLAVGHETLATPLRRKDEVLAAALRVVTG